MPAGLIPSPCFACIGQIFAMAFISRILPYDGAVCHKQLYGPLLFNLVNLQVFLDCQRVARALFASKAEGFGPWGGWFCETVARGAVRQSLEPGRKSMPETPGRPIFAAGLIISGLPRFGLLWPAPCFSRRACLFFKAMWSEVRDPEEKRAEKFIFLTFK